MIIFVPPVADLDSSYEALISAGCDPLTLVVPIK